MVKQNVSAIAAFDAPIPSREERRPAGKERRIAVPRSSHAVWDPPVDRRDGDAAHAYADQTERDHAALLDAIDRGVLPAMGPG